MMKTAFVFPGQGSQAVGMGKDLAAAFPVAKHTLQEVDDALSQNLSELMQDGPAEDLNLTENTQPAIMAASLAVVRVLEAEGSFNLTDKAAYFAGHSLGEYSALCAAGVFSLADTAKLLKIRGKAMQEAVPAGKGAMAAILGGTLDQVEDIAKQAGVTVANDNATGQVVLSGDAEAINTAIETAKDAGIKRAVLLNVSAPFHCPLMAPAAEKMAAALSNAEGNEPTVPIIANVTAQPVTDVAAIKELLVEQVTGRVRWRESVLELQGEQVERLVECGHGNVLTGMLKRITKEVQGMAVQTPADVETLLKTF